jgi:DNA polymerase elongation subunit (family B)
LITKLEIIDNNRAMANVCKVPFSYLFLRGQGVKIFSLVADFCSREGFLIPVLPKTDPNNDDKFEGAIVLKPDTGIHFEPIGVGDFNSLYPSSMISEGISHDTFVTIGGPYDNLPGYTYNDIEYDIFQITTLPGRKQKIKKKIGVQQCRYVNLPTGKQGILPLILSTLLSERKIAKKKMEEEKDPFKAKIWNGRQLALKIVANSTYGQCGAKTSPIYKVEIAASTTAVGRRMIVFSKGFIEKNYKDTIITLEPAVTSMWNEATKKEDLPTKYTGMKVHVKDSYCVYGDTDSVFIKFGMFTPEGSKIEGDDAINITIALTKKVTKEISSQLKRPQNIEFEKAICPFILFTKKRYHGRYFTKFNSPKFYDNSMGIALKRRDNGHIVKHVFGGCLDIIMNQHDIAASFNYVKNECTKMLRGEFPLDEFIISKTLRSFYKKPRQIAHNVLACRQAQRDPGNRFEPNDRVPYAYILTTGKDLLQGDKIETPDFIKQGKLKLDYKIYLTNQIMKPVSQIFELVPGYEHIEDLFMRMLDVYNNERTGTISLDHFMKKKTGPDNMTALSEIIEKRRKERLALQDVVVEVEDEDVTTGAEEEEVEIDEADVEELDGEAEGTSNYEDPNF